MFCPERPIDYGKLELPIVALPWLPQHHVVAAPRRARSAIRRTCMAQSTFDS